MGQGVISYTCHVYMLYLMQTVLMVPMVDSILILGIALMASTPFYVLVGFASDKFGRKIFIVGGMFLSVLLYYPFFGAIASFSPHVITNTSSGTSMIFLYLGYNPYVVCFFVFLCSLLVLVYAPMAAFLVELFPTEVRYTSLSLPYHVGNGVMGGLTPIIGLNLVRLTDNAFAGLWYPMIIAGICGVVGFFFLPETKGIPLEAWDPEIEEIPNYETLGGEHKF
eukprot:TRINITY_DN2234_c0_g1_i1.p1 TRINITY_DN2234_c0_g1~~TRINITY_DN2234_c0_g1_i1.p1  ORF type:complete len:223 (-),score=47.68 TRINITY_DN2234_c0_g1_i1:149-817(-)